MSVEAQMGTSIAIAILVSGSSCGSLYWFVDAHSDVASSYQTLETLGHVTFLWGDIALTLSICCALLPVIEISSTCRRPLEPRYSVG